MGDAESGTPWSRQTVGERIVTAAWRAVAAHLAQQEQERAAAEPAGPTDAAAPAGHDRLR